MVWISQQSRFFTMSVGDPKYQLRSTTDVGQSTWVLGPMSKLKASAKPASTPAWPPETDAMKGFVGPWRRMERFYKLTNLNFFESTPWLSQSVSVRGSLQHSLSICCSRWIWCEHLQAAWKESTYAAWNQQLELFLTESEHWNLDSYPPSF